MGILYGKGKALEEIYAHNPKCPSSKILLWARLLYFVMLKWWVTTSYFKLSVLHRYDSCKLISIMLTTQSVQLISFFFGPDSSIL